MKTKNEKAKNKIIKSPDTTDRLIARMILGFGLTLTVASGIHCAMTHPQMADLRCDYDNALSKKIAYLDDYEKRDEFKLAYDIDVKKLNDRLIARQISGEAYDNELKYMESNAYTEEALMQTASEQIKKTYDQINKEFLDAKEKKDGAALPFLLNTYGVIGGLVLGVGTYSMWNLKKKKRHLDLDIDDAEHHISEESFKKVMELEDIPYQGDDYIPHSKGNEDTQKYMPFYVEKHGIIRILNNEDIEEENENRLGTRYYDANSMTIKNTNGTKEDEQFLSK